MVQLHALEHLSTPEDCARLDQRLRGKKAVALWATAQPRQNVDVLLALEEALREAGVPVIFLVKENAIELVARQRTGEEFFVLEDTELFRHLPCIDLLVTHDYVTDYIKIPGFKGKVLYLNHVAAGHQGVPMDYYTDYLVEINEKFSCSFDYSFIPNFLSVQHNPTLTIIPAGSVKLDLLAAARAREYTGKSGIISFYPLSSEHMIGDNAEKIASTVREWSAFVAGFFQQYPGGTFVFSPAIADRSRPFIREFAESWRHDRRFIFSEEDDNKYWMARSDFLLTDWSAIESSWAFSTLRPVIYLRPDSGERPGERGCGYIATTGAEALKALARAQKDLWRWKARLLKLRHEQFPFFGKSVATLCEAIQHIISADFPAPLPSWGVIDKKVTKENPMRALLRCHCLRKRQPTALRQLSPFYIWQNVFRVLPQNGCLTLAAIDEVLVSCSVSAPNELVHSFLLLYLAQALSLLPQHILYTFLLHKFTRYKDIYTFLLLCITASHEGSTKEQRSRVQSLMQQHGITMENFSQVLDTPQLSSVRALSRDYFRQMCAAGTAAPPETQEPVPA